ncbi:MAG TPA: SRPBCC family protein [Vicinamibacterales bacterium]|nr:SRPBCC family protein [Vicinamibacterales bacterium]
MPTVVVTDRIEKKVLLRAPRARVWNALTDVREFEQWFGVKFERPFAPGALLRGVLVGSTVDAEVAKAQRQHASVPFEITVDRIEPEFLFSFRWHPFAVEQTVDYSKEPTTLVEFVLEETPGGVMLTVSESGFDRIPLERRSQAFTANDGGWSIMIKLIETYLGQAS